MAQDGVADPACSGPIVARLRWLQGTLLGTVATAAAVIAIASVGFPMLTGRINWRYGAVVILGCFILFGALARPTMFAGVTYIFSVVNAIIAAELFLIFRSPWVLLAAVVSDGAGVLLCLREPRIVDLWITLASRCPRVRNHRFWGCNSYRP